MIGGSSLMECTGVSGSPQADFFDFTLIAPVSVLLLPVQILRAELNLAACAARMTSAAKNCPIWPFAAKIREPPPTPGGVSIKP